MKSSKKVIGLAVLALIFLLGVGLTAAQEVSKLDFPTKRIQLICHSGVGGPTDIVVRKLALSAERFLGQGITVINKKGGATANQQAAILSAPADGYTLGTVSTSHIAAWNGPLKGKFTPDQFAFTTKYTTDPFLLAVKAESPFKTLMDMAEWAKKNPGKLLVGGFGTVQGSQGLTLHMFAKVGGFKFTWVPHAGGAAIVAACLGGHVDVIILIPQGILQHVQAGSMRVLGVLSDKRLETMPDVPTFAEQGYPVDTSWSQFRGFYGKRGIPQPVVQKLNEVFQKAIKTPDFQNYLKSTNMIEGILGPDEFTKAIKIRNDNFAAMLNELRP